MMNLLTIALGSFFGLPAARAFTWNLTPQTLQQCGPASFSISSNVTLPQLEALLIPFRPVPQSGEPTTIYDIPFNGLNSGADFQIKYPAGTQFMPLIGFASAVNLWHGDSYGFSVYPNASGNSTCWDVPAQKPLFTFSLYPNRLAECEQTRVYWNPSDVQGNPSFISAIVNGDFFAIDPDAIDDVPGYGKGFVWRPPIQAGSSVAIVAGDSRSKSSGGALILTVGSGTPLKNVSGILSGECPPSNGTTLTYPPVASKQTNIGMIVGIVVGVVFLLVAIAVFFFVYRRRSRRRQNKHAVISEKVQKQQQQQQQQQPQGGWDRQLSSYLPEPMSTSTPATQAQQVGPPVGLYPLYPEPYPSDRSPTHPSSPSTGVASQPSGTYARPDGLQGPWNSNGIMSVAPSSPSPTRGLLRPQINPPPDYQ